MKKHHASNSDVALKQKWIISQQGSSPGISEQELDDHYVVPPEDPGFGGYEIDTDGDLWR
jgi:hypothetical protein